LPSQRTEASIERETIKKGRTARSYDWKVTNGPAILLFIVPGSLARRKGSGAAGQFFWAEHPGIFDER
jgi:hypothetical protein